MSQGTPAMALAGCTKPITHGEAVIMENYGTIWVCQCCMLAHANGECCADDQHGGDGCEPLSAIEAPFTVAMGMAYEEHAEDCETHIQNGAPDNYECDCETNTYSTSQCEGCGSYLHGERHAMTLFGPELQEWERDLLANS
jgi:hypothetical protein